jgi:hypothetical protein
MTGTNHRQTLATDQAQEETQYIANPMTNAHNHNLRADKKQSTNTHL